MFHLAIVAKLIVGKLQACNATHLGSVLITPVAETKQIKQFITDKLSQPPY